jgi:hypothetical protein
LLLEPVCDEPVGDGLLLTNLIAMAFLSCLPVVIAHFAEILGQFMTGQYSLNMGWWPWAHAATCWAEAKASMPPSRKRLRLS